jgi:hypothetical protein
MFTVVTLNLLAVQRGPNLSSISLPAAFRTPSTATPTTNLPALPQPLLPCNVTKKRTQATSRAGHSSIFDRPPLAGTDPLAVAAFCEERAHPPDARHGVLSKLAASLVRVPLRCNTLWGSAVKCSFKMKHSAVLWGAGCFNTAFALMGTPPHTSCCHPDKWDCTGSID